IVTAKTGVSDKPIDPPVEEPPPKHDTVEHPPGTSPWWKDPIGDALTVGGVVGLGVGAYFLYSGKQAEDRSHNNDSVFKDEQDKAASRGKIGVVVTITGGALLVGGIVRYMTRPKKEGTSVTGYLTPDGGG